MSKSFAGSQIMDEEKPRGLSKSHSMKKIGTNKKILPTGFEQNVIVKEFEIEKGGSNLTDLISLYQSAVEYYDSIGDRTNSALYSQKITYVFMKPHISKMFLTSQPATPKVSSKKEEAKIGAAVSKPPAMVASNEQSVKQLPPLVPQPPKPEVVPEKKAAAKPPMPIPVPLPEQPKAAPTVIAEKP